MNKDNLTTAFISFDRLSKQEKVLFLNLIIQDYDQNIEFLFCSICGKQSIMDHKRDHYCDLYGCIQCENKYCESCKNCYYVSHDVTCDRMNKLPF